MTGDRAHLARLARLAVALEESGQALKRLAPEAAADQLDHAADLRTFLAVSAIITPIPPSAPPKPARMTTAKQRRIAAEWMQRRYETWPADQAPPSAAQDLQDAARELPGVARDAIRRARPPEWQLLPGQKPKPPE